MATRLDQEASYQICGRSMLEVSRGMKWVWYARAPLNSTLGCAQSLPLHPVALQGVYLR